MRTIYWLEFWVEEQQYEQVYRTMGEAPVGKPRSIAKVLSTECQDSPQWYEINSYLDILDDKYEELAQLGVARKDISLWISSQFEQEVQHLSLDPITLLRLGEEGIKPCIICQEGNLFQSGSESRRQVEIKEILIDAPLGDKKSGSSEVTVCFDDGSAWMARFISFQRMQALLEQSRQDGAFLHGRYFWQADMILVQQLKRKTIEKTIVDLLGKGEFEQAFVRLDGDDPSREERFSHEVELTIIHDRDLAMPLESVLGVSPSLETNSGNFWSLKQSYAPGQPTQAYLSYFLDLLENKYRELSAVGIQRKDISISWMHPYQGHCNLEFEPEILERMGRNGISFSLSCFPVSERIRRSLY